MFSIGLNGISLIWSTSCEFGNAILFANGLIILGYVGYTKWAFQPTEETGDGKPPVSPRNSVKLRKVGPDFTPYARGQQL